MRYKEGEKERDRYQQKYIMSGEQIGLKVRKNQRQQKKVEAVKEIRKTRVWEKTNGSQMGINAKKNEKSKLTKEERTERIQQKPY